MRKRNLTKSQRQRQSLEDYYLTSGGEWSKNQLQAIGQELDLTRQQVYKWLWDKKNAEREKAKQDDCEPQHDSPPEMHQFSFNRFSIQTPTSMRQASQFTIDPSVSFWAMEVLKREGWQLCLEAPTQAQSICRIKEEQVEFPHIRFCDTELLELSEHQLLYRLNKFEMVEEQIQERYPFLNEKGVQMEVKHEYLEQDDNDSVPDMNRFIDSRERVGLGKEKFARTDLAFYPEKGSSEDNQ